MGFAFRVFHHRFVARTITVRLTDQQLPLVPQTRIETYALDVFSHLHVATSIAEPAAIPHHNRCPKSELAIGAHATLSTM